MQVRKKFTLTLLGLFSALTMQCGCAMMDYEKDPESKYLPVLKKLHEVTCKDTSNMKYSEKMQRQSDETAIRDELNRMTIGMNMEGVQITV